MKLILVRECNIRLFFLKEKITLFLIVFFLCTSMISSASCDTSISRDISQIFYQQAFDSIVSEARTNGMFKNAIYFCENAFYQNKLSRNKFEKDLGIMRKLVKLYSNSVFLINEHQVDSVNNKLNLSLFHSLCDTVYCLDDLNAYAHLPFQYNFIDPFAKQDWSNMFVTKLLATHQGNCHSLAYLYKILADEIGAKCWLSLAPNHIYIRNYSDDIGWYNTELTSASFPTDAWLMMTGYISPQAIRSGLYMDTLSNQQSIALCALDLAKEYEIDTHNYYDGFIIKCCDLVLLYHSINPMALLLKAETLKKVYIKQAKEKDILSQTTYAEMIKSYITLAKLGYREMPEKMYQEWITGNHKKYENKKMSKKH